MHQTKPLLFRTKPLILLIPLILFFGLFSMDCATTDTDEIDPATACEGIEPGNGAEGSECLAGTCDDGLICDLKECICVSRVDCSCHDPFTTECDATETTCFCILNGETDATDVGPCT